MSQTYAKIFDEENILIYERKGKTFIPSGSTFPIFEHALRTGERVPARATFEFTEAPFWERAPEEKPQIRIISKNLDDASSFPKLVSVVKNTSRRDIQDIAFVALLFDENRNLVNASKTILSRLKREDSDTLVFTWPESFTTTIAKIEIIPVDYTVGN